MKARDLKTAIAKVLPAVRKNSEIPILRCLLFRGGMVVGSDGSVVVATPLEFPIERCIPAHPLMEFLKSLPTSVENIAVEVSGAGVVLTASSDSVTATVRLSMFYPSEFPDYRIPLVDEPDVVEFESEPFAVSAKFCRGCMVEDFAEAMSGLFLAWDGTLKLRSTDRVAMVEVEVPATADGDAPNATGTIPASAVDHLIRLRPTGMKLRPNSDETGELAWFWCGGSMVGTRVKRATNVKNMVAVMDAAKWDLPMVPISDDFCDAVSVVLPVAMQVALERMELVLWNGTITVSASGTYTLETSVKVDAEIPELDVAQRVSVSATIVDRVLDYCTEIGFPEDYRDNIVARGPSIRAIIAQIRPTV